METLFDFPNNFMVQLGCRQSLFTNMTSQNRIHTVIGVDFGGAGGQRPLGSDTEGGEICLAS